MATGKVLNAATNTETFSSTFANIFSCCFANSNNASASDGPATNNVRRIEIRKQETDEKQTEEEGEVGGGGGGRGKSVSDSSEDVDARGRGSSGDKAEDDRDCFAGGRDLSDRDSIPGDDFRDSAIDSASLSSQLNPKGKRIAISLAQDVTGHKPAFDISEGRS